MLFRSPHSDRANDVSVVLDLMIHDIDLVLELAKAPVVRLAAAGGRSAEGPIDYVNATLGFENGVITLNSSDSSMQHSKLRRVIYIYRDNELVRLTTLANKEDTILSEEIILTDVLNLKFTFGLEPENLTDEWPINNLNEDISFPDYIFMTYQYDNQEFKQLFSYNKKQNI